MNLVISVAGEKRRASICSGVQENPLYPSWRQILWMTGTSRLVIAVFSVLAMLWTERSCFAQQPAPELTTPPSEGEEPAADAPPPDLSDEDDGAAGEAEPDLGEKAEPADPSKKTCAQTSCGTLAGCAFTDPDDDDVECYAHHAWEAGWDCVTAVDKPPARLNAREKELVATYFKASDPGSVCAAPHPLVRGAFNASVIKGGTGLWGNRIAVQILPTFTLGIPFGFDDKKSVAQALSDVTTIGGVVIRGTPASHWLSAHLMLGTTSVKSEKLDPIEFPNPRVVVFGAGVDGLGGMLGLTYVWAQLRHDGLFGKTDGSDSFFSVDIDLTAAGLALAGALGGE